MRKVHVSREEKIEMLRHLIEIDEVRIAVVCSQSWQIALSVLRKIVNEVGSEKAKEAMLLLD